MNAVIGTKRITLRLHKSLASAYVFKIIKFFSGLHFFVFGM